MSGDALWASPLWAKCLPVAPCNLGHVLLVFCNALCFSGAGHCFRRYAAAERSGLIGACRHNFGTRRMPDTLWGQLPPDHMPRQTTITSDCMSSHCLQTDPASAPANRSHSSPCADSRVWLLEPARRPLRGQSTLGGPETMRVWVQDLTERQHSVSIPSADLRRCVSGCRI